MFWLLPKSMLIAALFMATTVDAPFAAPPVKNERTGTSQRIVLEAAPATTPKARGVSTIHWQSVPLREAVTRLQPLFGEHVFVDRRLDGSLRVDLDATASSAEQVLTALAAEHNWGVAKLGKLAYLGPMNTAKVLPLLANARVREVVRLPPDARSLLTRREPLPWPRLAEPRQLVTAVVEKCGWKLENPDRVPHDLWAAGELPELNVAEQLTVLLIGFDLTFELHAERRAVRVVPLPEQVGAGDSQPIARHAMPKASNKTSVGGAKQVYTLRVQEKPVGAVLRELSSRLHWVVQIDEDAIRAAGRSLDTRVSFSVENVDREKLLDALLTPAGLECRIESNQIRIMPQRY